MGVLLQVLGLRSMINRTITTDENIFLSDQESIVKNIVGREVEEIKLMVADLVEWDDLYEGVETYDYEWSYENATRYYVEDKNFDIDFINVLGKDNDYYEFHGLEFIEASDALGLFYNDLKQNNIIMHNFVIIKDTLYLIAGGPITKINGRNVIGHYIAGRNLSNTYLDKQFSTYLVRGEYLGLNDLYDNDIEDGLNSNTIKLNYFIENQRGDIIKDLALYFSLQRYYNNYKRLFMYTVLITLIVGSIIYISLLQATKKLDFLVQETIIGVDRIAKGDYNYKINETKNLELNQVINHVNHMGTQI